MSGLYKSGQLKSCSVYSLDIYKLHVNKKGVHTSMISNNGKDVYYEYGVKHSFEKMTTQQCFFLKNLF